MAQPQPAQEPSALAVIPEVLSSVADWLATTVASVISQVTSHLSAIVAVATLLTAIAALWSILLTRKRMRVEQTPVITLAKRENETTITNIGRGLALNLVLADLDGKETNVIGFLEPGRSKTIRSSWVKQSVTEANYLYYQDLNHGWHFTRALAPVLGDNTNLDFEMQIGSAWLVPRSVRLAVKRTPSALEHWIALSNPWNPVNYLRPLRPWFLQTRRRIIRAWFNWRERKLRREFEDYPHRRARPDAAARGKWEVDIGGRALSCGGSLEPVLTQYDCGRRGATLVMDVEFEALPWTGSVRGLVIIRSTAFSKLSSDREERNQLVFKEFQRYYCLKRPQERFFFSLYWA